MTTLCLTSEDRPAPAAAAEMQPPAAWAERWGGGGAGGAVDRLFRCTPERRWIYDAAERRGDGKGWEGEDRFRLLVQHSSDLIVVIGRDGTVLYATPASEAILGCRPEELSGRPALSLVHWEDRARTHQTLSGFLLKPGENLRLEVRVRHADGHLVDLEAHCRNLLDARSIQGVVVNARDVTERKAVEEEVKRQLRQLNGMLAEQAAIAIGSSRLVAELESANKEPIDVRIEA